MGIPNPPIVQWPMPQEELCNRAPRIMINLVMVINYCCKEILRPWSDIDPNWPKWV